MGYRTFPPDPAWQDSDSALWLTCSLPRKCTPKYAVRFAAKVCALLDLIGVQVMLNPSAEHLAMPDECPSARFDFYAIRDLTILTSEQHLVHDASRHKREEARDQQGSAKEADHRLSVALHAMAVRLPDAQRKHYERKDRQEMDRAPRPPGPDLMHPERARRHDQHERRPGVAERTVLRGALDARQLHRAQDKGPKCSKSVHPDGQRGVRQGCQGPWRSSYVNYINIGPLCSPRKLAYLARALSETRLAQLRTGFRRRRPCRNLSLGQPRRCVWRCCRCLTGRSSPHRPLAWR